MGNRGGQLRIAVPRKSLGRLADVFNRVGDIPTKAPEVFWFRKFARKSDSTLVLKGLRKYGAPLEVTYEPGPPRKVILKRFSKPGATRPNEKTFNLDPEDWLTMTQAILETLLGPVMEWSDLFAGIFTPERTPPQGLDDRMNPIFSREGSALRVRAVLLQIIRTYIGPNLAARIKNCQHCKRWFADTTRNRCKLRCSPECTWRTWNRARRREATPKQGRRKRTK